MSRIIYRKMTTYQPSFKSHPVKYAIMEIKNEKTVIHGKTLLVNHFYYTPRYQVPDRDKKQYYIEPLGDPDINAKQNRSQYLKQVRHWPSQLTFRIVSIIGAIYAILLELGQYSSGIMPILHWMQFYSNSNLLIGLIFLILTFVSIGGAIFENEKWLQDDNHSSVTVGITLGCGLIELLALA